MTKSLPANPSLVFLRKEAKAIRKSLKQNDASACPILRNLYHLKNRTDDEILSSKLSLQEVQFALALEYGFKDWKTLKAYVEQSFRQVAREAETKDVEWGSLRVLPLTEDRIPDIGRFLLRVNAQTRPAQRDGTLEGACYYVQRLLDYHAEDPCLDIGMKASSVVYDESGEIIAVCMLGAGSSDQGFGVYDYYVDPAYDYNDLMKKMLDNANNVIAENRDEIMANGCKALLHVWRDDEEDDAAFFRELGFAPTGLVEEYDDYDQTISATLNEVEYRLEWLLPERLDDLGLADMNKTVLRTPDAQYAGHVHPLYNIHCELLDDDGQKDLDGKDWPAFWRGLMSGMSSVRFALVAFQDDKLAGYVRFFPADKAHLRAPADQRVTSRDTLLVGAACVDAAGQKDGLEKELVKHVIQFARTKGYRSIQALGWSDLRNYSVWGESFPMPVYESLGFSKAAEFAGSDEVLDHMIEGHHGDEDKQQVEEALEAGRTRNDVNTFRIMQLDLKTRKVTRDGTRVWIEGLPETELGERWDMLLRSAECVLKFRGEQTDLGELMVYSGDAFSASHADNWQYMAYLFIPTDTLGNVARHMGYEGKWLRSNTNNVSDAEARKVTDGVLESIWSEIDRGHPVPVAGCADQGCAKWSVVVGYDKTNTQMCHTGIGGNYRWTGIRGITIDLDGENYPQAWNGRLRGQVGNHIGGWLTNLGFILGDKTDKPDPRVQLVEILGRAVELFNANSRRIGNETFHFGKEAYRHWAKDLAELDYPADTKKPVPEGSWHLYSMENVDYMVDLIFRGRTAAAEYLQQSADEFPECRDNLLAAAKHYREEVEMIGKAFTMYFPPWNGSEAVEEFLKSKTQRKSASEAILKMLEYEKNAITEISKVLSMMD